MKPAHRRGNHGPRQARAVVTAANADPNTRCWRCHRTLAQHPPHRNGRRAYWTAGHTRDGDPTCPLLPEASTCNYSAGGKVGRARQDATAITPTRDRYTRGAPVTDAPPGAPSMFYDDRLGT